MIYFFKRLNSHIIGMKLKYKLLITYIILIIFPLGLFSHFSYGKFKNILEEKIIFSIKMNYDQSMSYLEEKVGKVIRIMDIVITNENINIFFKPESENLNMVEKMKIVHNLSILNTSLLGNDIYSLYLYLPEENSFKYLGHYFKDIETLNEKDWYQTYISNYPNLLMCPYDYFDPIQVGNTEPIRVLTVLRSVKDIKNLKEIKGLVRLDFREESVQSVISRMTSMKGGVTYIQNSVGEPVVSSNEKLFEELKLPISYAKEGLDSDEFKSAEVNGQRVFYMIRRIKETDWFVTTVIPYNSIFEEVNRTQKYVFLLMLIIVTTAFLLATYLAHTMTKRIYILSKNMKNVQRGNLHALVETSYNDEIGELTQNYNSMLHRISYLVEERYNDGLAIKEAELKLLQAQINPHFLYNTLDMINWLAQMNKIAEVEYAISCLSDFFKLGLSKGKNVIPIGNEIEHIVTYVKLQNMRFDHKIHLVVELDEEIKDYMILRLSLQPIIENAILHGIMKKPIREGTIIVEGIIKDGCVVLFITDDGIGMSATQVQNLEGLKPENNNNNGYGVRNIIERMKLFYGEEYGLFYKSVLNEGTTVEIRFPAKEA